MNILNRIQAWTGCAKQYWEGVAICREHGKLTERELRFLGLGMTSCKQEELINKEVARIKSEQELLAETASETVPEVKASKKKTMDKKAAP